MINIVLITNITVVNNITVKHLKIKLKQLKIRLTWDRRSSRLGADYRRESESLGLT